MTLIYSPRATDWGYSFRAREAFCSADVFLRNDQSPFFAKFSSESKLLFSSSFDGMVRIVEDLKDKRPFESYSDPHSASIQDWLSEEEKFGQRRPVWDILNKAFNEVRSELFPDQEIGGCILCWVGKYQISSRYKDLEKTFLEQLRKEFGTESIKVFASHNLSFQGEIFPKETSLDKNFISERELEQLKDFVALSTVRLDVYFHDKQRKK